ncbi:MAG: hypothetical protein JHD15_26125, partial [Phenylobacterium sp.]|uniref:hypothetical protein n=1 Tax=Phenylobacterium sp. TaxID=1871053 RepID=UPI001A24883B
MTLKRLPVAALACLTAATSTPPVAAQPRHAYDGAQSADACAELGFNIRAPDEGYTTRRTRPSTGSCPACASPSCS